MSRSKDRMTLHHGLVIEVGEDGELSIFHTPEFSEDEILGVLIAAVALVGREIGQHETLQ